LAGPSPLTHGANPDDAFNPRRQVDIEMDVSPDGEQVVFAGTGRGYRDLYLLNVKTGAVTRLAETSSFEENPSFAPDGKQVVYTASASLHAVSHVFTRSLDGSRTRQLTQGNRTSDTAPCFSPDGSRIAFVRAHRTYVNVSVRWTDWDLYAINVDGTHLHRVTRQKYYSVSRPAFSSDGKSLLYAADPGSPNSDQTGLCLVDAVEAQLPHRLPRGGGKYEAVFAPGGKEIVFTAMWLFSKQVASVELYRMHLNGTWVVQMTRLKRPVRCPRFAANGQSLFFLASADDATAEDMRVDLWKADADGTNPVKLARSRLFDGLAEPPH
jgi:Tol biopolymer transport system component